MEICGSRRLVQRAFLLEQRDWCAVTSLVKSDGQRFIFAIGGKNYSGVDLRSVEKYDCDRNRWQTIRPILRMKKSIFASALCFEDRYLYVLAADCQSLEVLDTERESDDKMFDFVPLSFSAKVSPDLMRPLLLPLDESEIIFLHSCQDS